MYRLIIHVHVHVCTAIHTRSHVQVHIHVYTCISHHGLPGNIELLAVSNDLKQLLAGLLAVASVQEVPQGNRSLECANHMHRLTLCPPVQSGDIHVPYSAKFLRRIIFAFFAEWSGSVKIRRREKA